MPTLTCYRAEKEQSWGTPELRLCDGLTVRDPLPGGQLPKINATQARDSLILQVWAAIKNEIDKEFGLPRKKVDAFAQSLRQSGKVYAIATAATREGAYEGFNYVIEIPNARTFRWGDNLSIGEEVDWVGNTGKIDAHYIVLNAESIEQSTVLGFGHKAGTYEITFFTDIPTAWIKSVNEKPVSDWKIKKKSEFTIEDRRKMGKLVRPPFKWTP
ncbi:hypothetical protein ACIP5Y_07025 [Nocardia sp. NPDC088792]|uniref:hypothetical protein n=1 Tax=Nocardia sp. NPDC088792 TaxID=3364332 RepID=UPI00381359A8